MPVSKRIQNLPKPGEQVTTEADRCKVRTPCAETASDIAKGIVSFCEGTTKWFLLWSGVIGLISGFGAGLAIFLLQKRHKTGWGYWGTSFGAACGVAFLLIYILPYKNYLLPLQKGFVASDWLLRELREGTYIPEEPDATLKDTSVNCSDRIQDIMDGKLEGCEGSLKALGGYSPVYSDLDPLAEKDGSARTAGFQARAKDVKTLFAVPDTWSFKERPTSIKAILDTNENLNTAVLKQASFGMYLPLIRWFPIGHGLFAVLCASVAALMFLWISGKSGS
jgi:hypothetical protein